MHDLKPITALGAQTPLIESVRGVTLTEVPDIALASVAARCGHEDACQQGLAGLLSGTPPVAGQCYLGTPFCTFWMGPQQWMVTAPFATHEQLATQVKKHLGKTASVTEQTDGWVCFDLAGQHVEAVLEISCNLNIRSMKSGNAQRTSIHHMGCFVLRLDPAEQIRIFGPRSSAGSLQHALKTAMLSAL